jgi:hypothetical protein
MVSDAPAANTNNPAAITSLSRSFRQSIERRDGLILGRVRLYGVSAGPKLILGMKQKSLIPSAALIVVLALVPVAVAADVIGDTAALIPLPHRSVEQLGRDASAIRDQAGYRAWKISLIPVLASQALDASSSYGMRELNPVLADANGRYGMKANTMKFSAVTAILGVEYLIVRSHPGSARILSKLNWSSSVVTGAFAAHNFAIR